MSPFPFVQNFESRSAREKNWVACAIVLAGIALGSLFVDIAQLVSGSGFSAHVIRSVSVLEAGGKTWVAYTSPPVALNVVTDSRCANCSPDEALVWLRRILPTIMVTVQDVATQGGEEWARAFGIRTLPSFVFESSVKNTDFFTQAGPLFIEKNQQYLFDMSQIGLPIGKYLDAPTIPDTAVRIGSRNAPVKLMIFSDFECQYCRAYHSEYRKILAEYPDQVEFIWRDMPLPAHRQALSAAQAARCAHAQGKFLEYADILFGDQPHWSRALGLARFNQYATRLRGVDMRAFQKCLQSQAYAAAVQTDLDAATDWGVSAAPTTFVNTDYAVGSVPAADLRSLIQTALAH